MSTTKLEAKPSRTSGDFECGLACNNVEEASRLIGRGEAALRLSVYPWGVEFDVVRAVAGEEQEGDAGAVA